MSSGVYSNRRHDIARSFLYARPI